MDASTVEQVEIAGADETPPERAAIYHSNECRDAALAATAMGSTATTAANGPCPCGRTAGESDPRAETCDAVGSPLVGGASVMGGAHGTDEWYGGLLGAMGAGMNGERSRDDSAHSNSGIGHFVGSPQYPHADALSFLSVELQKAYQEGDWKKVLVASVDLSRMARRIRRCGAPARETTAKKTSINGDGDSMGVAPEGLSW